MSSKTKFGPIVTKALFQSVTNIQQIWDLLKKKYSRLAFRLSEQLAENGENICRYAEKKMVPVTW